MTVEPRKRPKQERSQAMVDRILEAAHDLLNEAPGQVPTTNAIAARAGLSVGSLYQYFPNKEAIVLALAKRWLAAFPPISQAYVDCPASQDRETFRADFHRFTHAIAKVYRDNRNLLPILDAMQSNGDLRDIGREHDLGIVANHAAWYRHVDPTLSEEDARRLGLIVLDTGHAGFLAALNQPAEKFDAIVEDIAIMHEALLARYMRLK